MKKNILIWGTAIILVVVAIFVTTNYKKDNGRINNISESPQAGSQNKPSSNDTTEANKAIDFTLSDLDGNKVSLKDFHGKNVYLNFWATWCPPCRKEMPAIEKLYKEYKDKGLVVLAIDLGEDKETVKNFINENNYSFKVLLDSDQSIGSKYNISAIPVSYFIDKDGNIAAKRVGAIEEDEMRQYIKDLMDKK
ncbi:TlpA family protein disulfide reductase [Pseudobacteroides cellulosolvens]|uniref:Alkyl hydroperoxide reductase/ Thiol specific antioxidant/ Mal allergen n=1 Tax=Pseudobacteroides cellulosolvens ATCC 35603 = DSM 2933 TaxID=398512 RepID=A0A0L6JQH6_9FIRM|nr:TlpA disulfide reductase family protein [Pseudobacteroides cellulosolvens]KNY28091.1 alkyl hydroperoxide reductase/ Thiol specific antioxidant/ Mal allergen [Pseudobacteroides cellulosolvens ATCC 35603 = DSM 2933]